MVVVEIQKTLCGRRNIEILIKFTCFDLKFIQAHILSEFSQVRIFCDNDLSKLASESMHKMVSGL